MPVAIILAPWVTAKLPYLILLTSLGGFFVCVIFVIIIIFF